MPRLAGSSRRPFLILLASLSMALAGVGLHAGLASGAPPMPVRIVVDGVHSTVSAPAGTPAGAVPYVLVEAGQQFSVDVSFYGVDGAPASFNKDTTLSIATNTGPDNLPSAATGTAPAGATSATLTTSLPHPANQVEVTVGAPGIKGPHAVTPGTSSADQRFDVLQELQVHASAPGSPLVTGIGGEAGCTSATPEHPVCGVALLPNGAQSAQVMLSLGLCDTTYAGCGSANGSVVQALADLTGLYTKSSPAAILVRCDKSLCGQGPLHATQLSYSLLGNAALTTAPACPGRNTIGADQAACVDYVQSTRDNAGDSLLYFLFTSDARVSVR